MGVYHLPFTADMEPGVTLADEVRATTDALGIEMRCLRIIATLRPVGADEIASVATVARWRDADAARADWGQG